MGFIMAWDMAANWDMLEIELELELVERDPELVVLVVLPPYSNCCCAVAAAWSAARLARSKPCRLWASWLERPVELVEGLLEDLLEL